MNMLTNFTYLSLLLQSPKDFIYSLISARKRVVHIEPFDPKAFQTAEEIIYEIKHIDPSLKTYLVGSVGLQIPGQNDIDLIIETIPHKSSIHLSALARIFGKPLKLKKNFAQWGIQRQGYDVEITFLPSSHKWFKNQITLFRILKNNRTLLYKYQILKSNLEGLSERDYLIRRMRFFNSVSKSPYAN